MTPFTGDCEGFTVEGEVMVPTLSKVKPGLRGLDEDTPLKSDIPRDANHGGYLESAFKLNKDRLSLDANQCDSPGAVLSPACRA